MYLIFKAFFHKDTFPKKLKIAKVYTLFKSGNAENVTNYRPVSVLPVFSTTLGRIKYYRIYKRLENDNLLLNKQFGFEPNNSTEHVILFICY